MREHHNDGGISIAVATGIHTVRCRHRNGHMLGVSQIHHVPQCPLFEHQTLTVAAAKHNCCFVSYAAFSIRLDSNPRPYSTTLPLDFIFQKGVFCKFASVQPWPFRCTVIDAPTVEHCCSRFLLFAEKRRKGNEHRPVYLGSANRHR